MILFTFTVKDKKIDKSPFTVVWWCLITSYYMFFFVQAYIISKTGSNVPMKIENYESKYTFDKLIGPIAVAGRVL